jgi:UDP-N-acetylmuramate dehydrogenase
VSVAVKETVEMPACLFDEPMSRHTSWRVGGPADAYYRPTSIAELRALLQALPRDLPLTWVGLGSNLLVRDGGLRGAVVATTHLAGRIEHLGSGRVRACAGATCARLARQCTRWHLGPAAFFAGIPGTVGGALAMNAGAFGAETWERIVSVETIDREGNIETRSRNEFAIGYRSVTGPTDAWFVSATWQLETDAAIDMSAIREMLARRAATQPTGQASCGSVFRNPVGDFAGAIIERAGLKGARVGGAFVSEKHANFIVNDGSATAADIEALIAEIRERVARETGVSLELEVRIVGAPTRGDGDVG